MELPPIAPLATPSASAPPAGERRNVPDRRQKPTSPWGAFSWAGRRRQNRRADEHRRSYFVDCFSPAMLIGVLALVSASLVDAVLTVQLLNAGGKEINPLMDRLLAYGAGYFLLGKYLLTVAGLPLLLVFKNHYLFGTRLRVGHLIPVIVALYLMLIVYQTHVDPRPRATCRSPGVGVNGHHHAELARLQQLVDFLDLVLDLSHLIGEVHILLVRRGVSRGSRMAPLIGAQHAT